MSQITSHLESEIMTDCAGGGFGRTCCTHRLTDSDYCVRTFPYHGHHRRGSYVRDQAIIKQFAFMNCIMGLSQLSADVHEFSGNQPKSAAFEAGSYFTNQSTLYTIRFDKH